MITIRILCVGNLKEKFWKDACQEYNKRLGKFCKLEIIELPEKNIYDSAQKIVDEESKEILARLGRYNILLAIEGKECTSENFASKIGNLSKETSEITFIIGGSYGVNALVKMAANEKLSFGKATYPHNLARIILLEQIYRAFMINSGSKYHK